METIKVLFGIILFVIVYINLGKLNKPKPKPKEYKIPVEEVHIFVKQLESIDYYKYADTQKIELLKTKLTDSIIQHSMLDTEYTYDRKVTPLDFRLFILDAEALYEEGGFLDAIERMQPLFDKINFKIDISNHLEEVDITNTWLNHHVTINEKEYIIFKDFKDGYGWGEAAQRFAEIINDQLQLQDKEERLYLINGDSAIF
jgi:hypothetical protein